MSGQISSQEARRRVAQLGTFEDGFWDMLLGKILILLSIYPMTRKLLGPALNLLLFFGMLALLVAAMSYARRTLSIPRIGIVKTRRGPLTTVAWITLFVVTVTLVIATLFMTNAVQQPVLARAPTWVSRLSGDIFFAALIIGFFAVFAQVVGVGRLHLYGWLMGLGNVASAALMLYAGHNFNLPLAIAGLIMVLTGSVLFRRFTQRYPLPAQDH